MTNAIKIRRPEYTSEVKQLIDIYVGAGYNNVLVPVNPDDDEPILSLCAITDNFEIVGGSVCIVNRDDQTAELDAIVVQEQSRSKGIGSRLLEESIEYLTALGIKILKLIPGKDTESYFKGKGFSYASEGYMFQNL